MSELAKSYQPDEVEPEIRSKWDDTAAFHADPAAGGEPFGVVIPPPNVTAALHMGHALNNTLQDILVRWRRMQGRRALWMPGTDHAGIATQTVVEKRVLLEEGKRRTDFERGDFVERIQAWKDEYEARITEQLRRMGCSCDWDRQRFTMDAVCCSCRARGVLSTLCRRSHLPRQATGQLGSGKRRTALADGRSRDGGRRRPSSGTCVIRLSKPVTVDGETITTVDRCDDSTRNHAWRHRRRRESQGPARSGARGRQGTFLPIVGARDFPLFKTTTSCLPDPERRR